MTPNPGLLFDDLEMVRCASRNESALAPCRWKTESLAASHYVAVQDSQGTPEPMVSITWLKTGDTMDAPAPAKGQYQP